MQVAQLGAGLHADRLHERRACVPIGLQRLRLPARAIQREHLLRAQSLAQRLIGDQRPQLAEHLAVAARDQVGVDRQLGRLQPQLLQPPDLGARERLISHVGQRAAAPQRERRPCFSVRRPVGMLGRGDQPLEPDRIDTIDREPELVAATAREDLRRAPAQQLAQLGHVELHHLGRRRRRALAPQSLTQPIGRHGLVDLQREHRQHGALLWRTERYRPAVKARLDRPEETNVHVARLRNDPTPVHAADQSAHRPHIYRRRPPCRASVPRRHRRPPCPRSLAHPIGRARSSAC